MYHIKSDKRCAKSCVLIYAALIDLIGEKPFDDITISDIQVKSTVGRATFYRNFDTIIDVLMLRSDEECCQMAAGYLDMLGRHGGNKDEEFGIVVYFFHYWRQNTGIVEILLKINRMDILYNSLIAAYENLAETVFPELDTGSDDYKYLIAMKASIGIGFLTRWIAEGKTKTVDELLKILHNGFQTASKYLLKDI